MVEGDPLAQRGSKVSKQPRSGTAELSNGKRLLGCAPGCQGPYTGKSDAGRSTASMTMRYSSRMLSLGSTGGHGSLEGTGGGDGDGMGRREGVESIGARHGWHGRDSPLRLTSPAEVRASFFEGAPAGVQKRGAKSLQRSATFEPPPPSQRSTLAHTSLERVLQQGGTTELHTLPEGDMEGAARTNPMRQELEGSATGTIKSKGIARLPTWPGAGGQPEKPQSEFAIGGARATRSEEGQQSTSGRATELSSPRAFVWSGASAEGRPASEERLLNSISLTELYLGDRFASGTYGRIYTGNFRKQTVAIKILRSPESAEAASQMRDLFRREVTMLAQLSHPNIVQFVGACQKPPLHCLVSELLPGGTVRKYLSGLTAPPPFAVALRMALDVARGMEYLHSCNIIHRDLKADNLVLSASHVVKLTDFGSARVESEQGAQMTAETGTFKFMAPEVIRRRAYSRKVDVYSFGILLWELFTAEVAFAGMSGVQAAFAVVNKGLRPRVPSGLPSPLRSIICACWHQNPDRRPDFSTLVPLLEALRTSRGPVPALPPPRHRRLPFRLAACFRGGAEDGAASPDSPETASTDSTPSARRAEAFFQLRARPAQR